MAYTVIDNPSDYFNSTVYNGNESTNVITTGLANDFVWVKAKDSGSVNHYLFDSVRGVQKNIHSNTNDGENTESNTLTAFNSTGFTLGSDAYVNGSGQPHISWNWKAGTAFSNDASATGVGSIDSAGSVNTDSGFSIIQFSGTGSLGTVAHGLGVAPSFIAFKRLDTTGNWVNYHKSIGATKYLRFDTGSAEITASDEFNDTEPTSTVFTVETDGAVNASGTNNIIAYCFAEVKGFSKFGSYVGNGNADGTFVYTGFKPAFVLMKNTVDGGANWQIFDNKRDVNNVANHRLFPSNSDAESTNADNNIDIISNGFKMKTSNGDTNSNGVTFIYMAFAENPFVTSTGIPATAR